MKTEDSILLEAHGLVHGNRGADYGHPLDDFTKTAKLAEVIFDKKISAEEVDPDRVDSP